MSGQESKQPDLMTLDEARAIIARERQQVRVMLASPEFQEAVREGLMRDFRRLFEWQQTRRREGHATEDQ